MSETNATEPPAWVSKRDGRLEPFDADKICQSLFAASEALGSPNAFLARELTDAVLHFLAADAAGATPATAHIADHVVKVVRELGQPALAQAFAQGALRRQPPPPAVEPARRTVAYAFSIDEVPGEVVRRCLHAYTERAVFSPDLLSAQGAGLLQLVGLETPRALARCMLESFQGTDDAAGCRVELPSLCEVAGQGIVVDGPEWRTADPNAILRCQVALEWLAQLSGVAHRHVVVNLNAAEPPAWARRREVGPLFAAESGDSASRPLLDALLLDVPPPGARSVRWDWHLQSRDFAPGPNRGRLQHLAQHALAGSPIAFVFDRARRPVALAEGMDRSRPAVLMEVGLDLEAFLRLPEVAHNGDAFFAKLPSLARMAVSAGTQKRKYLRRHAEGTALARGFLLDRACLAIVPLGLDVVARLLTARGSGGSSSALELARQLVQRLDEHMRQAGRHANLEVVLDCPGPGLAGLLSPSALCTAGPTFTDAQTPPGEQLRAAGALHLLTGQGTARVHLPHGAATTAEELVELLHYAWRRTEVVRVVLVRPEHLID